MVATPTVTAISGITLFASPRVRFITVVASIRADATLVTPSLIVVILKKSHFRAGNIPRHPVYGAIAC